jgi:hypothetical protein
MQPRAGTPPLRQRLQQGCLRLRSEALQGSNAVLVARTFELLRRGDAQLLVEYPSALDPDAGQLRQLQQSFGELLAELLVELNPPRADVFGDDLLQRWTNAGELPQPSLFDQAAQVNLLRCQRSRCAGVCCGFEGVLPA